MNVMMPVKAIPLTQGHVTIIDPCDYELVSQYTWHANRCSNRMIYASTRLPRGAGGKTLRMHVLLAGPGTDHANGDGLDNRRENLRPATKSQNAVNTPLLRSTNTSGFRGVHRKNGSASKWVAQIRIHPRHLHLGIFADPVTAALAYDAAALEAFGEYAVLNFPAGESHG